MLHEMMTVSGWLFWVAIAVVVMFDVAALSMDDGPEGVAVLVSVAAFVGAVLLTDAFVGVSVRSLVAYCVVYAVLGLIWSVWSWYLFLVSQRETARGLWERSDTTKRKSWEDYARDNRPTAANNKQMLVSEMTLWPLSLLGWATRLPRKVFVMAYEQLSTLYDRIADKVFQ